MNKLSNNIVMKTLRVGFGIFMVLLYLGVACLLFMNFFDWADTPTWKMTRYTMASIFAVYGVYRCYRQVKGIDYYRLNNLEEQENDQQ